MRATANSRTKPIPKKHYSTFPKPIKTYYFKCAKIILYNVFLNLAGFGNLRGFYFCPSSTGPGNLNLMAAAAPKHEGYSKEQDRTNSKKHCITFPKPTKNLLFSNALKSFLKRYF